MIENVKVDQDFKYRIMGMNEGYAYTIINGKRFYIHRVVMNAKPGEIIDHINRDKLDNRKENLRVVTKSQNGANSMKKGYSFHKCTGKWRARVMKERKEYAKYFNTEEEAKEGYKVMHVKHFGEYSPYYKGDLNG